MKKEYVKPAVDSVKLTAAWAMCLDGSGESVLVDPTPTPAPTRF